MTAALWTKPAVWFDEFDMKKLEWPAQSPNLNPIGWFVNGEEGLLIHHQYLILQMIC